MHITPSFNSGRRECLRGLKVRRTLQVHRTFTEIGGGLVVHEEKGGAYQRLKESALSHAFAPLSQ